MRLFYFDKTWSIILCFILWPIFQLTAVWISRQFSDRYFAQSRLFRERSWEDGGEFYEHWFKVRRWKHLLPDGGAVSRKRGFRKRYLSSYSSENLQRFLIESARGELAHCLAIWPFILFFLFLEPFIVAIMFLYALVVNLPCIIVQRYNRPRIQKILRQRGAAVK